MLYRVFVLLAPLVGASVLVLAGVPSASASSPAGSAGAALPSCPRNTWSSDGPSKCAPGGAGSSVVISPAWVGGNGCGGYYTGSSPYEMKCRDTSTTVNGFRLPIREGYWNPAASPQGFGWAKAYHKHNLWMQPMIDTVRMALTPAGSWSSRDYEVYHYNPDGYLDQEVVVVADIASKYFAGTYTQDGHVVGVITGYCNNGSGGMETECPDWVNSTL